MNRRNLLKSSLSLAGSSLLASQANAQELIGETSKKDTPAAASLGCRKLGKLEVSSMGLGVQNMSRTYQTTIPSRIEMHKIIRTAFDRGVTLFDAAEAYGPFEVERILGEALVPIRNNVVIETKFGWNIDQKTGQHLPGLQLCPNSTVLEGCTMRGGSERDDQLLVIQGDEAKEAETAVIKWLRTINILK